MPRTFDPQAGWAAVGNFQPMPWAGLLTEEFKETLLTFSRSVKTKDLTGAQKGSAATQTAQVYGHVEIEDIVGAQAGLMSSSVAPIVRRYFLIMVDPDDLPDVDVRPRPGDVVAFTDPLGIGRRMRIDKVDAPEGILDHIEIATEDFS